MKNNLNENNKFFALITVFTLAMASCVPVSQKDGITSGDFVDKNTERKIASEQAQSTFNALSVTMSPRIGDREYIFNVFTDIFGPASESIVRPFIINNAAALNGGCSQYEATYSELLANGNPVALNGNFTLDDVKADCNLSVLNLSIVGTENAIREGLRLQACESVVNNNTALFYLIDNVTGVTNAQGSFNTLPSPTTVSKMYNRFYPGQDISPGLSDSLMAISASTSLTTAKDKFKLIALTICMTADWQIP